MVGLSRGRGAYEPESEPQQVGCLTALICSSTVTSNQLMASIKTDDKIDNLIRHEFY